MEVAVVRQAAFLIACLTLHLPALASEPGQPLDCSDWVFLEPGYSCRVYALQSDLPHPEWWTGKGSNLVVDNAGRAITVRFSYTEVYLGGDHTLGRTELVAFDGQAETVIAYVDDRLSGEVRDHIRPRYNWDVVNDRGVAAPTGSVREPLFLDLMSGTLFLELSSHCSIICPYPGERWIAAIDGFTTTFEILQTYEPTADTFGFRVPYMPEGFQTADWFDSYYGDLSIVGDWSQVQPLRCGYPATSPSVGGYLTIVADLPDPAPGQGYYFVTAVNYQGQRRYGRKSSDGELSGRDPALLPLCTE